MKSRKLASQEGENPPKRLRVSNHAFTEIGASFDTLNDDCVLTTFSFLPLDDINTLGTINRRCRVLRRHESLNQTRIATISCSRANQTTSQSLHSALATVRNALNNQYTYLRLIGLETVELGDEASLFRGYQRVLRNVTKLELRKERTSHQTDIHQTNKLIQYCFPNVKELLMNSLEIRDASVWNTFLFTTGPRLAKVTWLGDGYPVRLDGWGLGIGDASLTDLSLDRCCFRIGIPFNGDIMSWRETARLWHSSVPSDGDTLTGSLYILADCKHLERLSLKGATWCLYHDANINITSPPEPIPQEMLIKMVRCHKTLRWLQSDLTQENVAMLQEERPEITFVSD